MSINKYVLMCIFSWKPFQSTIFHNSYFRCICLYLLKTSMLAAIWLMYFMYYILKIVGYFLKKKPLLIRRLLKENTVPTSNNCSVIYFFDIIYSSFTTPFRFTISVKMFSVSNTNVWRRYREKFDTNSFNLQSCKVSFVSVIVTRPFLKIRSVYILLLLYICIYMYINNSL